MIRSWDHDGGYDFALPVDCDELLAVFTQDGLSVEWQPIRDEFRRLKGKVRALRIDMSLFNVPGRRG